MDIFKCKPKTMVSKHLVVFFFLHQNQFHPINNKKIKHILYKKIKLIVTLNKGRNEHKFAIN